MPSGGHWRGTPWPQRTPRTSRTPRNRIEIRKSNAGLYYVWRQPRSVIGWMTDLDFRPLWIWKVQDTQIWNLCGWEKWTLKSIWGSRHNGDPHACKIFSLIVEGSTWSTWSPRPTRSSWRPWSLNSSHRFGFWSSWPPRKRWCPWSACKCQCINAELELTDGQLNEVFWVVGFARFTRYWWLTGSDGSQRRKGKWCSDGQPRPS